MKGFGSLVSFKSQFSASQDKAHNRNIATKIHKETTKLRAGVDASPTTPRRWVWELVQNAKDVNIDGKVRVRIEADLDGSDGHSFPRGIISERSSPSRVRCAAKDAPLTAAGRSEDLPLRRNEDLRNGPQVKSLLNPENQELLSTHTARSCR